MRADLPRMHRTFLHVYRRGGWIAGIAAGDEATERLEDNLCIR
jgi:hypothetical protein